MPFPNKISPNEVPAYRKVVAITDSLSNLAADAFAWLGWALTLAVLETSRRATDHSWLLLLEIVLGLLAYWHIGARINPKAEETVHPDSSIELEFRWRQIAARTLATWTVLILSILVVDAVADAELLDFSRSTGSPSTVSSEPLRDS